MTICLPLMPNRANLRRMAYVGVLAALVLMANMMLSAAATAQCPPGEILVDEDDSHWYCKTAAKYQQCVANAGRQLRNQIHGTCGRSFADCINQRQSSLIVSIETGSCLATALVGCSAGVWACASICGAAVTAIGSVVVASCYTEVATDCFEDALADDRQRKLFCKRGDY